MGLLGTWAVGELALYRKGAFGPLCPLQGLLNRRPPIARKERRVLTFRLRFDVCAEDEPMAAIRALRAGLPPAPGEDAPGSRASGNRDVLRTSDLVVDPMCGIGTTALEAVDLGRRAVGVEL
jgi:hypothetical protein